MAESPTTRERILAGAARAFGQLGYAATRVEDILRAAEVSRPTFYKLFKGKNNVFQALSDIHHAEIFQRLVSATEGTDGPAEKLDRVVEAFLRWRAQLGPIGRVLDTEARVPNSRLQAHRRRVLDAVVERMQSELRRAGREDVDPLLLRALIAAAENVADSFLQERRVGKAEFARRRAVLSRLVRSALTEPGDPVPPVPRQADPCGSRCRTNAGPDTLGPQTG
jgi:AcrR family transcriptional regulator